MATFILDTFYTKKKANQKYWDFHKSVWCKTTVTKEIHGEGKRTVRNPRCADSRTILYNCPDHWTLQDVETFWHKVICMTPFGIPKFEHDYNQIVSTEVKSINGVTYLFKDDSRTIESR